MTNSPVVGDIDTRGPNPARMHDHHLGGRSHFDVDKEAADEVAQAWTRAHLMDAPPSGSALALTPGTLDFGPESLGKVEQISIAGGTRVQFHVRSGVARFFDFDGLELLEPGLAVRHRHRRCPEPAADPVFGGGPSGQPADAEVGLRSGVALKP